MALTAATVSAIMIAGPITVADDGDDAEAPESYARPYDEARDAVPVDDTAAPLTSLLADDNHNFFLNNSWEGGNADIEFTYGKPTDHPVVGDWDGDGVDTVGVRRDQHFYLRNTNSGGNRDIWLMFGHRDDEFLIGDWDGDSIDTVGARRGHEFFLRNSLMSGDPDVTFKYGRTDDAVFVGDWDGDGVDTLAVRRGHTFFVKNEISGGIADHEFKYGRDGDEIQVGDWDGDGQDTFAVRRGIEWHIRNDFESGPAQTVIKYGREQDSAIVGDWDGDATDTPGVHRKPVEPDPPEEPEEPEPPKEPPLPRQVPVMVYGTLRTGQPAHHVVQGRFNLNVLSRAGLLELWVTDHPYPSYPVWPWAVPGKTGLTGEMLFFPQETYTAEVRRMDDWEGYTPGGDPNKMNYIRQKERTAHDKNAWVYVATPWRESYAKNYGTKVISGDITRF